MSTKAWHEVSDRNHDVCMLSLKYDRLDISDLHLENWN